MILITFGCSWTVGVGVGYESGMTDKQFSKLAWDDEINNNYSFRGLLSKKYNLRNINFAAGGSSNQRQFRLLKAFFGSPDWENIHKNNEKIIVMHGITSTARSEVWVEDKKELHDFMFNTSTNSLSWRSLYANTFYNHDNEVERLGEQMRFFNTFYRSLNVKNIWFDTFNHHDYTHAIDNLHGHDLEKRDLLSLMAIKKNILNIDDNYHRSLWRDDTNRISFLTDLGYLNPISKHPTKKGHELIAEILDEPFKQLL